MNQFDALEGYKNVIDICGDPASTADDICKTIVDFYDKRGFQNVAVRQGSLDCFQDDGEIKLTISIGGQMFSVFMEPTSQDALKGDTEIAMLNRDMIEGILNMPARQIKLMAGLAEQLGHEVNNPLGGLPINLDYLKEELRLEGEHADVLQEAIDGSRRAILALKMFISIWKLRAAQVRDEQ